MKIKRFFAADMRQALRQVKETLGADAVILSNKSVEGGVELVAAKDYDESAFLENAELQEEASISPKAEPTPQANAQPQATQVSVAPSHIDAPVKAHQATNISNPNNNQPSRDSILDEMRREMIGLRRMMENEISGHSWRGLTETKPQTRDMMRQLMDIGLSPRICRSMAEQVSDYSDPDLAWKHVVSHLTDSVNVLENDILDQGGVIALVGPTGVGKTTTIAKLAARYCLTHGNRNIAMITTDHYRIGAHEQLHTYGRILDVPVRTANSIEQLNSALNMFASKKLVLIDTAGMSQRDLRLSDELTMFKRVNTPIRTLLTLSANTQQAALDQSIDKFAVANPYACVLTKTDEAALLGGALSTLINSRLPLAYITDGQKVPEDLHLAKAGSFVDQAIALQHYEKHAHNEDYLALNFGGSREHAHV